MFQLERNGELKGGPAIRPTNLPRCLGVILIKQLKPTMDQFYKESEVINLEKQRQAQVLLDYEWKELVCKARDKGTFPNSVCLFLKTSPTPEQLKRWSTDQYLAEAGYDPSSRQWTVTLRRKKETCPIKHSIQTSVDCFAQIHLHVILLDPHTC
jgi:hypothetical protein